MAKFNPVARALEDTPVDGHTRKGATSNWAYDCAVLDAAHAADLAAHTRNLWETMRVGEYYLSPLITSRSSSSTALDAANRLWAMPFPILRNTTWDRIAIQVSAQAGQKFRLGIYNNAADLKPGTKLVDAGEITLSGTGQQAITFSAAQSLTKGLYWVAIVSDGQPTINDYNAYCFNFLGLHSGWSANNLSWYVAHTYGALPDSFGTPTADYRVFGIALRLLTLD